MNIDNILKVNKKTIITVVGAGGKTSLIKYLSNYYKKKFKILLTTTTKIYVPRYISKENIFMIKNQKVLKNDKFKITVLGKYINKEDKIIGLSFDDLDNYAPNYDITLIEGDGAKMKKLKGWNETEPVVYEKTTKTIGIIDITSLNIKINEENIHRLNEFKKITSKINGIVELDDLKSIILSNNGLFKNSAGVKYLFINKVENSYYECKAIELIHLINKENKNIKIFYGSLKNKNFKILENI